MSRITVDEAAAWGERTKINIEKLDDQLLAHVEEEIFTRLNGQVDTSTWVDNVTTPKIIRTIISKKYFALVYFRQYSEDVGTIDNTYATRIDANAEMLMTGILDGSIIIPGVVINVSAPTFYPNDASDAVDPKDSPDDLSVGPAHFSLNQVF
jgi:hypothetical protein